VSELITVAAAASTDTTLTVPAGAIVLGTAVRVVTAIPTAGAFTVTGASSATSYVTGVLTAAGTTNAGTSNCPKISPTSEHIRITPDAIPADGTGQVRLTVYYMYSTPPTS
jgi:hypothetical protein